MDTSDPESFAFEVLVYPMAVCLNFFFIHPGPIHEILLQVTASDSSLGLMLPNHTPAFQSDEFQVFARKLKTYGLCARVTITDPTKIWSQIVRQVYDHLTGANIIVPLGPTASLDGDYVTSPFVVLNRSKQPSGGHQRHKVRPMAFTGLNPDHEDLTVSAFPNPFEKQPSFVVLVCEYYICVLS